MRPVIYTVIIGAYEPLLPPHVVDLGADYVCLCDVPMPEVPPWKIRIVEHGGLDNARESRRFKHLAHRYFPEAEYTLYQDANVRLKTTFPFSWLDEHDIAVCPHNQTNDAYQEFIRCLRWARGNPAELLMQMVRYIAEGFPSYSGAVGCFVILRRHTDDIARFNEAWWNEILTASARDQVSFNYVSWKLGIGYDGIPYGGNIKDNEWFEYADSAWHRAPKEMGYV